MALAWTALWASFGVFCVLVLSGVLLLKHYWESASDLRGASVSVISGTVLVKSPRQPQWVSATSATLLREGDRLRTDEVSQAFVTFFDYSTLVVYSNTEVKVERLASSRFMPRREQLELAVVRGKGHLGVAPTYAGEKSVSVATPNGRMSLEEGSYTVSVVAGRTQLRVAERGRAHVSAGDTLALVETGQRLELGPEGTVGPIVGQEELVYNGDFSQGLRGWQVGNSAGFPEGADVVGEVSLIVHEGRPAVRFNRHGSRNTHNETYLFQEIHRDVSDFTDLRPILELRLEHQSLSGGGYLGSEYPIIIRVNYRTATTDYTAGYGFYYQNLANNRTDDGLPVPASVWVKFTAPTNLMTLSPPPKQVLSIQVSASGWDYESLVANISLAGQ